MTLDKLFELLANFTFLVIGVVVILRQRLFTSLPADQGSLWAAGLLALPLVVPDPAVERSLSLHLAGGRSFDPAA